MLLAYKFFYLSAKTRESDKLLRLGYMPEIPFPIGERVISPCELHEDPVPLCTCGVISTIDLNLALSWMNQPCLREGTLFPVLGLIQVLGETIQDGLNLRSWGGFLYGLVDPYERYQETIMRWAAVKIYLYSPIIYGSFGDSVYKAVSTWREYGL